MKPIIKPSFTDNSVIFDGIIIIVIFWSLLIASYILN